MKNLSAVLKYTLLSAGVLYGGLIAVTPLQAQAEMTSKQLTKKKEQIDKKIKELNTEISKANSQLEIKIKEFEQLQLDIEIVKDSIHKTELRMNERSSLIDERMKAYQEQESMVSPYLEVVLGAENLSDLLSRAISVKTIIDADKALLDEQEKDKNTLESKQFKLEGKEENLRQQFQEMQQQEQQLEVKKAENKVKSLKLKEQIATKKEKEKLQLQRKAKEKEAAKLKALAEKEFIKEKELAQEKEVENEKIKAVENEASNNKSEESASEIESDSSSTTEEVEAENQSAGNGTNGGKITDADQDVSSVSGNEQANAVIAEAKKYLGTSYVWGGSTPSSGFDCSGLTQWSFKKAGVTIPRTAAQQYLAAKKIVASEAVAGDLVFFSYGSGVAHVGIYLGDGRMLDSQDNGVVVESLDWWQQYLVGFGRF